MLYRNILGRALKVTWKNKYLWFFGIFAAFLSSSGEFEIMAQGFGGEAYGGVLRWFADMQATGIFSGQALSNAAGLAKTDFLSFIAILLVGLIVIGLALFLVWLSVVSQAALVSNSAGHLLGSKEGSIKSGLTAGIKKFWPVLGLNLLMKAVAFIVFLMVGLPIIFAVSKSAAVMANLLYVLMFIVFVLIVLALSFIVKFAIGYSVLKNQKFIDSLKSGWQLFVKNWIISLEMAVILFVVSLAVSLAYFMIVLTLAVPFTLLIVIFSKVSTLAMTFIVLLALVFYITSLAFVGSTLSVFQISSWTALFTELVSKGGESKIVRMINGLVEKV